MFFTSLREGVGEGDLACVSPQKRRPDRTILPKKEKKELSDEGKNLHPFLPHLKTGRRTCILVVWEGRKPLILLPKKKRRKKEVKRAMHLERVAKKGGPPFFTPGRPKKR